MYKRQVLHISRNTVSQYLNEFFKEGWMVKINTRPVYYFLRETLLSLIHI